MMWYSSSILWLLGSRYSAGLGGGYGFGQVKSYIKDMCEPKLAATLIKQLNFYGFFGTITAFTLSIFLNFREFSLMALIISITILFITLFLPSSPKDFIKANKIEDALILLNYLRGRKDHTEEIKNIHQKLSQTDSNCLMPIIKDRDLRNNFIKLVLLVFLQQFSGAPTSFVYCQIIFTQSGCSFPEYCAILYSIIFFTANVYGTFYVPSLNKKYTLILSSLGSSAMLMLQILVLYFKINDKWPYTSLFVMLLFITFYCVGIGSIPSTYISEWFPTKYQQTVFNIFIMEFYMCALVATKTFQVFMSSFPFYVGFFIFITADLFLLLFVIISIKNRRDLDRSYLSSNRSNFWDAKEVKSSIR